VIATSTQPGTLAGTLGRYELLEVIGRGSTATVHRARDPWLRREVAIKILPRTPVAALASGRSEALALAALKHHSILTVFDFVGAAGGQPAYLVSELVAGVTLRQLLDRQGGSLLPHTAAALVVPVVEALAVAHAQGIVHRDVKPDNVLIGRRGGRTRVVLIDFGSAQVGPAADIGPDGALIGSPGFMSPEQARGEPVGPASDIWAIGVLLYEMVTGRLPFSGRHVLEVMVAISRGVFARPSRLRPGAGKRIDAICGRCLRLRPERRYRDASSLAEDLRVAAGPHNPEESLGL
jgi:eukaryotic-like serine/threonine-protein kinase